MIALMDRGKWEQLPVAKLPTGEGRQPDASCPRCEAFRPEPGLDGSLRVDPEIHLPSPGMDVDIAYYHNSDTDYNGPYGLARTISPNLFLKYFSWDTGSIVTFTRGDGGVVQYNAIVPGGYVCET